MQEVHQENRTECQQRLSPKNKCPPRTKKHKHTRGSAYWSEKLGKTKKETEFISVVAYRVVYCIVCVTRANLWDTWGITSRSGSLDFLKGELKLLGPDPERLIGDLGDRGELFGESGGVDPSLKTPGSSDTETLELTWPTGEEPADFASSNKDITCNTQFTTWLQVLQSSLVGWLAQPI
jgi:hypothetical protein